MAETNTGQNVTEQSSTEQAFLASLQHLAQTFKFTPTDEVSRWPYPYNIGHILTQTRQQMEQIVPHVKVVVTHVLKSPVLATVESKEPEYGLYYIIVRPLFHLLRDRRNRARTNLICCIYAYLYRVAKIPYCEDDHSSYISCEYDYLREDDWSSEEEDEDAEHIREAKSYIKNIDRCSAYCRQAFDNQHILDSFVERVEQFVPHSKNDHDLMQVARRFLELYETFPEMNFDQATLLDYQDDNIYGEMPIRPDQYVGFIWAENDMIYQHIIECLNAEMSAGSEQGPYACTVLFDRPYKDRSILDDSKSFMATLLDSMADFGVYLDNIDHERLQRQLPPVLPA